MTSLLPPGQCCSEKVHFQPADSTWIAGGGNRKGKVFREKVHVSEHFCPGLYLPQSVGRLCPYKTMGPQSVIANEHAGSWANVSCVGKPQGAAVSPRYSSVLPTSHVRLWTSWMPNLWKDFCACTSIKIKLFAKSWTMRQQCRQKKEGAKDHGRFAEKCASFGSSGRVKWFSSLKSDPWTTSACHATTGLVINTTDLVFRMRRTLAFRWIVW